MNIFRSAFTTKDLISAATVACVAGNPIMLGAYTVPAGEKVSVGWGMQSGQESAQGRIYIDLKDNATTPKNVEGLVRITVFSPQNRVIEIMKEFRTETLRQNKDDRTKQIPFPEYDLWITEDKKVVLEFIADVDATVSQANSTILMDTTKLSF